MLAVDGSEAVKVDGSAPGCDDMAIMARNSAINGPVSGAVPDDAAFDGQRPRPIPE